MTQDDEIADAIIAQGMLSPVIEDFRDFIEEQHAGWFDFTSRVNRFAVPKWVDHSLDGKGESIGTPVNVAIPLMARCLDAFAASVSRSCFGLDHSHPRFSGGADQDAYRAICRAEKLHSDDGVG